MMKHLIYLFQVVMIKMNAKCSKNKILELHDLCLSDGSIDSDVKMLMVNMFDKVVMFL